MTTAMFRRVLRDSWLRLLLGMLLGALLAAGAVSLAPTTYSSTSNILVEAAPAQEDGAGFDAVLYVEERLPTYLELAHGDQAVGRVAEATGLDPETIRDTTSFEVPEESTVVTITADASSPQAAQDLSTATTDVLLEEFAQEDETGVVTATLVSAPGQGTASSIGPLAGVVSGAVAGGLVALLIVIVRTSRDRRPRHAADVAEAAEAPVLAVLRDPGADLDRATAAGDPTTAAGLLRRLATTADGSAHLVPLGGADAQSLADALEQAREGDAAAPPVSVGARDSAALGSIRSTDSMVLAVGPRATTGEIAREAQRIRKHGLPLIGTVLVP